MINMTSMAVPTTMSMVEHQNPVSSQLVASYSTFMTFSNLFCIVMGTAGCLTNIFNMIVFTRMGLNESINISLFGISISDFVSSLTLTLYEICMNAQVTAFVDKWSIKIASVGDIMFFTILLMFLEIAMILTAFVSFERCLCVAMPMKVKLLITPGKVKAVLIVVFFSVIIHQAPTFYVYPLQWYHDPFHNKTVFGSIYNHQAQPMMEMILSIKFCTTVCVYSLMLVCTAILSVTLHAKTNWRKHVTVAKDPSSSNKETKVAKVVLFISTLYICCSFPHTCMSITMWAMDELQGTDESPFYDMLYGVLSQSSLVGEAINITMNLVIYYNTSSKYNTTFNELFSFHRQIFHCIMKKQVYHE